MKKKYKIPNICSIDEDARWKDKPILRVQHDPDGTWSFLCFDDYPEQRTIWLEDLVELFPDIVKELNELPVGWHAWRESEDKKWNMEASPYLNEIKWKQSKVVKNDNDTDISAIIDDRNATELDANIFDELFNKMQELIYPHEFNELENEFMVNCEDNCNKKIAKYISEIDFDEYEKAIERSFKDALNIAIQKDAQAIYFEFDLDNMWSSNFFICEKYNRLIDEDDDWACDWIDNICGPDFEKLSNIYLSTDHFCNTIKATVVTFYLIARTVSSLGKIVVKHSIENIAITIGYHDQDPIFRIIELE